MPERTRIPADSGRDQAWGWRADRPPVIGVFGFMEEAARQRAYAERRRAHRGAFADHMAREGFTSDGGVYGRHACNPNQKEPTP